VGAHLVRALASCGATVIPVTRKNGKNDVSEREVLESFFQKNPEVIFHLAGEALVEKGQSAPYDTFRTNFMGTLNVLELSRVCRVSRVVIASTAHVYGEGRPPFYEDDPPRPSRPYEPSKTATDLLAQSYADSFRLPVVIPRFVNIYGPGDTNFTRLIPKTLQYMLQKKPVPMWGGQAKREYLYINDAVEAYLMLGALSDAKFERNRIFNFGAGKPVAVQDLIKTIGKLINEDIVIVKEKKEREGEITDQYVSWEKASRVLGWKPWVSLDEGLRRTIAWYRDYLYTTTL
ncbi:MAG: NAD(P)-dependent oxidoreductase, partial [Patescibacteria group bacterium]